MMWASCVAILLALLTPMPYRYVLYAIPTLYLLMSFGILRCRKCSFLITFHPGPYERPFRWILAYPVAPGGRCASCGWIYEK